MNGLESMVHHSLNPPHIPLSAKQIEAKFRKSEQKQNQYEFPRQKQSIDSSVASQSLRNADLYNLYLQNKNVDHHQQTWNKHASQTQLFNRSKTKIMKIKQIQEYSNKHSMKKKQRLRLTSTKNSPKAATAKRKVDLFPLEATSTGTNILHTPSRSSKFQAGNDRTKSRSGKKLLVLSARNIRKIQVFNFQRSASSHKKGIHICSRQKPPTVEVRTISIF